MPLPTVADSTVDAVFDRAESRHSMVEYADQICQKMDSENSDLAKRVITVLGGLANDKYEESSEPEIRLFMAVLAMGLIYDCLTTQMESVELEEMFGP